MSGLIRRIVIACSLVVLAYVTTGFVLGRSSDDKAFRALSVYSEVLAHVQQYYVDEPNMHQVTSGSLHGLLASLDAQSSYLSPLEYTDFKEKSTTKAKGESGLALTRRGYVGIVSVLPDSPGQKAGLKAGDILEEIAGFATDQMAIDQARLLLTGEPGTTVKLSVIRRGKAEPQAMEIQLAKLATPKILEDKLTGDIAFISVPAFESGMTKQLHDKLVELDRQGARKLILDLRGCALGDVSEGISTAQLFLPSGTITTLKGQTVTSMPSNADPSKVVWPHSVTVLISGGTSGAAEIVASAIADNHRGETVGDRTYGSASEQKLITLDDGSALILTVANYYTPGGKEIPQDGVVPTIEVRPTIDELLAQSQRNAEPPNLPPSIDDPVIKKAIEVAEGAATRKAA